MSILTRLFKGSAPQSIQQRIANLAAMEQNQLLAVAQAAEPAELRIAAANRLTGETDLLAIATEPRTPPTLKTAVHKRLGELIDSNKISLDQLHSKTKDEAVLIEVGAYSTTAGQTLVDRLEDEAMLLELAKVGATTQLRQAAANRVESKEYLDDLLSNAKQKDKAVYRIVKNKLNLIKQLKAQEDDKKHELSSLCFQAEQLAKHKVDDIYHVRLQQILDGWDELKSYADTALQNRFNQIIAVCEELRDEKSRKQKEAEEALQQEIARKKELYSFIDQTQQKLASFYQNDPEALDEAQLLAMQSEAQQVLTQASERGLNCKKEQEQIERLLSNLAEFNALTSEHGPFNKLLELSADDVGVANNNIKTLQTYLKLGVVLTKEYQPAQLQQGKELHAKWREQQQLAKSAEKDNLNKFNELLRKGNWAVNNGHPGRARAILRDLNELNTELINPPSHMANKLEDLNAAVEKLGDWHEFAVTPKKEALIKDMQALIDAAVPPKQLADKIQALQQQWKELCRGGQNQDEDLWQAFHDAAQQAYAPCKIYFEEQHQERELNSKHRRTLIQQMSKYLEAYNWQEADWGEVEKTLKIARDAWRGYWPVAKKDIKPLQKEFDQLMDALYEKLNQEYQRNHKKKSVIIDQAAKLLELADTQEAIGLAKQYQAQWRDVGRCKRKDEQALWKQFRAHCDAVFERRDAEQNQTKEEQNSNEATANSIIETIDRIAELTGDEFFNAKSGIDDLINEFEGLGGFSKSNNGKIQSRFKKSLERVEDQTKKLRHQASRESWQTALSIANKIRAAEQFLPAVPEQHIEQCTQAIEGQERWQGNSKNILTARLDFLRQNKPIDAEHGDDICRKICIKAEVALDVESPEQDKVLRMQYQVEQLQQNWHQNRGAELIDDLLEEWLATRGASDANYAALEKRFLSVLGW